MKDWVDYLDEMLKFNKLEVLQNAWKVKKEDMEKVVVEEIKKYQEKWWSLDIYIDTIKEIKNLKS
jgi:hypothetical protein